MTRLLITGASGFIGTQCLRHALLEEFELHAVNRSGQGDSNGRVTWHGANLRDPAQARAIVALVRPSHLLHGAWVATPGVYARSPDNVKWLAASLALAEAFGEIGGTRFLGIGTSAEYGRSESRCSEDRTPIAPESIYSKCKAASWLGIQALAQHHGFSAAWTRVFLAYGPGDPPERLIPSVLRALRTGTPLPTTEGTQVRDFVHVQDVAELLVRILQSSAEGAFNVGTGQGTSIRTVIETLADHCNARELLRIGALPMRRNEPPFLVADMSKTETEIGWMPPTSLVAGLRTLFRP